MMEAAKYSVFEQLHNGRRIEIRALNPGDRTELVAAVAGGSAQSLYRRFFGVRRHFTEKEIAFFTDVDFVKHVALIAVMGGGGSIGDRRGRALRRLGAWKSRDSLRRGRSVPGARHRHGAHAAPHGACPRILD